MSTPRANTGPFQEALVAPFIDFVVDRLDVETSVLIADARGNEGRRRSRKSGLRIASTDCLS